MIDATIRTTAPNVSGPFGFADRALKLAPMG